LAGNLDSPLDEPSIHLAIDEMLPKSDERSFAEWGLLGIQTIEHQLPSPIHECHLNHFII
jgi:hypothetical protein